MLALRCGPARPASALRRAQVLQALSLTLTCEAGEMLLGTVRASFACLELERPTAPLDQRDTEVQRGAVEQVHPPHDHDEFGLQVVVLVLFGTTGEGRESAIHGDDFLA